VKERTVITNLGRILSGSLDQPDVPGDTVLISDGKIEWIGRRDEIDLDSVPRLIDAHGTTAAPGLIDTHVHIVFGDWTPRQNALGWIESYMQGGITAMMSACEVHLPGRPTDPIGVKALAITAQRAYANYRPGGVKVYAGSVILEPGLTDGDFAELAAANVWLAKMGFGGFAKNRDAEPQIRAAQKYGFLVMSHTGGASIPGSSAITADDLLYLRPDIAGHANGGTTALPEKDLARLVHDADFYLQISQAGNIRSAIKLVELARDAGKLSQILVSSDTPTGTGVMPLGTLKSVVEMSALTGLSAGQSWALATGNNAAALRKNLGLLQPGKDADILIMDAPIGSAFSDAVQAIEGGDLPGISCVMIDGEIQTMKSRNTPAASRLASVHPKK
jgi:enamidase